MGLIVSKRNVDFEVIVKTGDVKGAGTDSNVYIILIDDKGNRSKEVLLDCHWKDDFEKGNEDTFSVRKVLDLGKLQYIELWRDRKGIKDDWFVEYVKVRQFTNVDHDIDINNETQYKQNNKGGENHELLPFPINRWIEADRRYVFKLYDSLLPQDDLNIEQREKEMEEKKGKYVYQEDSIDLPRRIKVCPTEENFSNDYKWDIAARKMKLLTQKVFLKLRTTSKWEGLDDLVEVYKGSFGIPYGYYNWKSDEKFGQQRLRGCNATTLHLCQEIPKNFPVAEEMVESFLDGKSLKDVLAENEIYIVNLEVMEGIKCKNDRTICPAMALFHAKKNGDLMPIAIQLFRQPTENNPVFYPSDPTYTWMLAKMYFNNSECSLHQACAHLGFTHLICESICVAVHRCLSPSHPVFRLLAPHFLYLIAINTLAVEKLLASEGWIDVTMTMGAIGLFQILKKKWENWRLDVNGWLPTDLKQRGVDDTSKLPSYLFRDDALKLHQAILDYVTQIINDIYDSPEKLKGDCEIQLFAETLTDKQHGAGIKGVFGCGKFETHDDLIKTLTSTIYIASVGHAAANFCQYDEYAFPPNYPALLNGEPPRDKTPITEQDIIATLPSKDTTLSIMVVTKLLSDRGTNSLGDFEMQYQFNPKAVAAVESFRKRLDEISEEINIRNKSLETPYPYLDPKEVPNAISI